ncbi:MAG: dihydrofolate reductase [Bacteroidaceae bacterium]|nr:dihydrofolate reductase [Bacteroidaceae bacterium]
MTLSIIVAIAKNGAIGLNNSLIYHLPDDMKHFKALTTGHTVIMGRKTFESFPKGALPNRRNVVLSRSDISFPGAEVFQTLSEALLSCAEEEEVFIIGGASIYQQALPLAEQLYLTVVDDIPKEADTFFPEIDTEDWKLTDSQEHEADERHAFPFSFKHYIRR